MSCTLIAWFIAIVSKILSGHYLENIVMVVWVTVSVYTYIEWFILSPCSIG